MGESLYRMEIAALDLGSDVRSVGIELIDPETREPVTAEDASKIWAAAIPLLAGDEPWVLDFFAHLDRVREFCDSRHIQFREPNAKVVVIAQPPPDSLRAICERFAGETLGVRAGGNAVSGDSGVEGALAQKGVDAYHTALNQYFFCAVCDFQNGFLTILGDRLWASEVIRRTRSALDALHVEVTRPA